VVVQNALRVVEQAIGERLKPVRKMVQFPPQQFPPHKKVRRQWHWASWAGMKGRFFAWVGVGTTTLSSSAGCRSQIFSQPQ